MPPKKSSIDIVKSKIMSKPMPTSTPKPTSIPKNTKSIPARKTTKSPIENNDPTFLNDQPLNVNSTEKSDKRAKRTTEFDSTIPEKIQKSNFCWF